MIRVNNILFDPKRVIYIKQENSDVNHVTLVFEFGEKLEFKGSEAAELWKLFDGEKDWRDND